MGSPVSVVKLQKSGGVLQRPTQARQAARTGRIREYFFGADGSLQPPTTSLDVSEMKVFRIGAC
jgi:polyribonucleotide 5'-hydroxyl-kinase